MAYATLDDVLARMGRVRSVVGQAQAPDEAEIEQFLEDTAGEIDARLTALGLEAPTTDPVAVGALRSINADGALILTLDGAFPNAQVDQAAGRLLERADARWKAAMTLLEKGELAAIVALISAGGTAATAANDFWSENPLYDLTRAVDRWAKSESVLPGIEKGMKF